MLIVLNDMIADMKANKKSYRSYFKVPKTIEFKDFIKLFKDFIKETFSFAVNDITLPSYNSLRFTKNLL